MKSYYWDLPGTFRTHKRSVLQTYHEYSVQDVRRLTQQLTQSLKDNHKEHFRKLTNDLCVDTYLQCKISHAVGKHSLKSILPKGKQTTDFLIQYIDS